MSGMQYYIFGANAAEKRIISFLEGDRYESNYNLAAMGIVAGLW